MCGIFGYVGRKTDAANIVLGGLKRLEYRGYDSWGVVVGTQNLVCEKRVGKIGQAKVSLPKSNIGIGHTRWATHGEVTQANAHPHLDCTGKIAVVHNGIVENYLDLRKKLSKKHKILSQTDTEVIVHLIEEEMEKKDNLSVAVRAVFGKLMGLNAVVAISRGEIVAAKNGSPLVLGIGNGENFIASDAAALLPHTKRVIFVKDGQMARINGQKMELFDLNSGQQIQPKVEVLSWELREAELGKFKHFMLKEIYEQPGIIRNIAQNYDLQVKELVRLIKGAKGTFFVGTGTAFNACLAGAYLFSKVAKVHVNAIVGSEFNYLEDFIHKGSLVIALSQSGETIDVIEPVKRAKQKGATIVALVNNVGSTIWQISDYKILLDAGPEMAVASTKAYSAKLSVLLLATYALIGKAGLGKKLLLAAADEVERIIFEEEGNFKKIAKELCGHEHIFTIGRGLAYQSALEAALKMKEVSYIHTEGLAGGELKHGPIALIAAGTPCIVFAPNDETYDAIISNAMEIKTRGGMIIGVSPKNHEVFDKWIKVADVGAASILPNVVPSQLFGYWLAVVKGLDPDRPRNLAKSVTVK
ncbi:MAG: Glucosamine/fructose-6-phosphate aminotransferase, isomerizing [Candidatus Curtissbacteria bacterium GW2011_GWA1_40_16]|uniref:Glutamine--fructose-6-phosphate aminotransferase [isomerizing] n=1 Tax=Candidatus Curtissbacteria bacterium GW2011_GWA1_40_16 TaxID=1618405 RepID=A0A0G0RCS0_9BACT|nr:MAG: Glucosamine/fructose-6-phosphate aminotransferase, isomerizing [Candidatus Curtissbacteria bacterium GW2011_GWA1_40_16]